MAQTIEELLVRIRVQGSKDLQSVKGSVDKLGSSMSLNVAKGNLYAEGVKFALEQVVKFGTALRNSVAEFQNYENQLRLISGSQQELNDTMTMLNDAAVANRASFGETVDLYTKLTLATETMGKSQEEVVNVMGKFQKALALSGADANTAAGAIRQFGQAMASGQVRGDEFNSIVEALGPALNIMARESGLTVGELRDLSQAGDLTAEAFFKMLESSNAIEVAFNKTQKTISQLEQEVSDAGAKMLANFAKESGLEDAYVSLLENLARGMRDLAGAQTELEAATPQELLNTASLGPASARLEELHNDISGLQAALDDYGKAQKNLAGQREWLALLDETSDEYWEEVDALDAAASAVRRKRLEIGRLAGEYGLTADQLINMVSSLEDQIVKEEEAAKSAQNLIDQQNALQAARQRAMRGLDDEIEAIAQYTKNLDNAKTPLQRNRDEYNRTQEVLQELQSRLKTSTEDHYDLESAMATVRAEQARLTNEYNEMISSMDAGRDTFQGYYNNLIDSSSRAARETVYQQQAISKLNQDLAAGRISIDTYAQGMQSLGQGTKTSTEEIATLTTFQRDLKKEVEDTANEHKWAAESLDFYRQILEDAGYTTEEVAQKMQDYKDQFNLNQELTAIEAFNQRWKELSKDTTDELKIAQAQADILFGGMEDAIDQLVDNGKFNFSKLVNSMIMDMVKLQLKAATTNFFNTLGGGTGGGILSGIGKIFGFAEGGYIKPGQVGLVGEQGPEFITGPANIIPMSDAKLPLGGAQNITYNINAVDALSFKQLVASDPEFIHNVAVVGGRNMPSRRRV